MLSFYCLQIFRIILKNVAVQFMVIQKFELFWKQFCHCSDYDFREIRIDYVFSHVMFATRSLKLVALIRRRSIN